jgi:peptidyl-dipeptidase Dcp
MLRLDPRVLHQETASPTVSTLRSTRYLFGTLLPAAVAVFMSMSSTAAQSPETPHDVASMGIDNPFALPSPLPYQMPPFDRIRDADYMPAFIAGMAAQRAEVDAIAHNPQPATFDNTVVALEKSGQLLNRVSRTFFELDQSNSDDAILKIEPDITPKLSRHHDAIYLDAALFARIDTLYNQRATLQLDAESLQLLERYHTEFVRAGAALGDSAKEQLRGLNERLASLTTAFRQNVLKATRDGAVLIDNVGELDGLSAEQIGAAADAAKARGLNGKWLITLRSTTTQPVLEQLKDRAVRERIFHASVSRAFGGPADNSSIIAEVVKLRAQRAALLGYPNHAAYVLADLDAGTPSTVDSMLRQIGKAALARAHKEADAIQQLIDRQAALSHTRSFKLQPWDWQYYSEQVRKATFNFDSAQVKPYFELNRVLQDGVFYAAHELYGLTFKERHDLPVYQSDVRVFEVWDADGSPLALFLCDYYARDNKQGGAWMSDYVQQTRLLGYRPVVVNVLNIPKPAAGAPTLLTFDEVTAMFHEFGHALHGMFSNVDYPLLAGTNVPLDFVEYPSQFNEMWAREPSVLAHFAYHYRTGEALPKGLLDEVLAAQTFDQGYLTTEYVEAAMVDMAWHEISAQAAPHADKVLTFEADALKRDGLAYPPVPPRYHSPYFLHIFSDGYDAGYYAYLWSEVLARDTGAWMHAHGGLTRANGDTLRRKVLSRGRTENTQTLFRDFYGGPPDVGPLLDYRGLSQSK